MAIPIDTTHLPRCTNNDCGADAYGPYHGPSCARSRAAVSILLDQELQDG